MELKIDVKTMIAVGAVMATMGGFYYSTQHRLGSLETQVQEVSKKLDVQSGELKQIKRQLKKK